jgi:8-oxo-dGTP pyrophosphatase MutT (NUDIX family)
VTDIRYFTASAVVLDGEDRVLLVHHNKIGLWLYPGGHVDPNEDPAQAAVREVAEETGIQAAPIGEQPFTHPAVRSHAAPWAIIEMEVTDAKVGAHPHIDLVYVCHTAAVTSPHSWRKSPVPDGCPSPTSPTCRSPPSCPTWPSSTADRSATLSFE